MLYGAAAYATETFSQGSSSFGSITVVPTGVRATFGLGTVIVTGNADLVLTGVRSTFGVGAVTIESKYDVTGVRATFAAGSVTVVGTATVTLVGVRATFAVGAPKLTIWNGVDDSNTDIWTVVPTG